MSLMPERENETPQNISDVVKEIPEEPEIPKPLEAEVKTVPAQITAQVTDDSGKPLMQSPATTQVTVTIPANQQQLQDWTKGSPSNSLTWFAVFWLRLMKKAMHFGWRIVSQVTKGDNG